MAMQRLEITIDGTVHEVTFTPGLIVKFERYFGVGIDTLDKSSVSSEHMLYMGWLAASRKKLYEGDFEQFLDDVEDINDPDKDEEDDDKDDGSAAPPEPFQPTSDGETPLEQPLPSSPPSP